LRDTTLPDFDANEPFDPQPIALPRVLIVHNRYREPGGEDVVADAQARLLREHGHVVHTYERDNKEINGYSFLGKAALYFRMKNNRASARDMARIVRDFNPRAAHVHNTLPLISPSIYAPLQREGVKVIQWLHNYRLVCPAGTLFRSGAPCTLCVDGDFSHAIKYKCWTGSKRATQGLVRMLRYHRHARTWLERVDLFVALNSFQKQILVEAGGLPESKVIVQPNFSNAYPYSRTMSAGAGAEFLFAGRLMPEKGISTLLRALGLLRDVPIAIAGDGPLRESVERTCASTGHQYLGQLDRTALRERMEWSRALLFTSEWPEGCPSVILEALACGKPVIASSVAGAVELLQEGKTGLFFPPGNYEALVACVRQLISHQALEERMNAATHARFVEHHSREAGYWHLMTLYEKLGIL